MQATSALQVHYPLKNMTIKYKTCEENELISLFDECFLNIFFKYNNLVADTSIVILVYT